MPPKRKEFIESGVSTCMCGNDVLLAIKTDESVGDVWEYVLDVKPQQEPRDCCKAFIGMKMDIFMEGCQAFVNMTGQLISVEICLDATAYNGQEKLDV